MFNKILSDKKLHIGIIIVGFILMLASTRVDTLAPFLISFLVMAAGIVLLVSSVISRKKKKANGLTDESDEDSLDSKFTWQQGVAIASIVLLLIGFISSCTGKNSKEEIITESPASAVLTTVKQVVIPEISSAEPETTTAAETTTEPETTTNKPETTVNTTKTTPTKAPTNNKPATEAPKTQAPAPTKSTPTKAPVVNEKPIGKTVYRTPKGGSYHYLSTCGGKNSYAVSIDDAKSAGLKPCQKCVH